MKERTFNRMLVSLCMFLILISCFAIASTYQASRYRSGDPLYRPTFDGVRWSKDPTRFTCLDYTDEMQAWLKKIGIKSYQVVGMNRRTGEAHSWVGVDVFGSIWHLEPQTLCFFNPSDTYRDVHVNYKSYH